MIIENSRIFEISNAVSNALGANYVITSSVAQYPKSKGDFEGVIHDVFDTNIGEEVFSISEEYDDERTLSIHRIPMGIAFPDCGEELKEIEFSVGEFLLSEFSLDFLQKAALIFFETFVAVSDNGVLVADNIMGRHDAALQYCYDHVNFDEEEA
jgi:hypothetical protein